MSGTRGYFGIGVDRISKPMNVGNLFRSAHAFGASFLFTVNASYDPDAVEPDIQESHRPGQEMPGTGEALRQLRKSDTSDSTGHVPLYQFDNADALMLPRGCVLVGVELLEDAVELPSFKHPLQAAYVMGPEKGNLSPELVARCAFTVKIPMKFCVNVGVAGAILMYDRLISLGRFPPRPVGAGGPTEGLPDHRHGGRFTRARTR